MKLIIMNCIYRSVDYNSAFEYFKFNYSTNANSSDTFNLDKNFSSHIHINYSLVVTRTIYGTSIYLSQSGTDTVLLLTERM
jgi:hypothetical protein